MAGWIKFGGYQLGNYPMVDVCEYDATKNYIITHDGCHWIVEPIDDFLKKVAWYNEATPQALTHDANWDLLRA